jgi:photosystem II stability/assembly factor-like uncharacterized protein
MKKLRLLFAALFMTIGVSAQVWKPVVSGTNLKLNSVSFGSSQVGYIGANDSTLLKTIDGGLTWNEHPTNGLYFTPNLPNIIQVDFKSELIGFAMVGHATYTGYMFKTIDGGSNWTPEAISMCSPLFCYNFDSDNSYVVGSACFGGKTIDRKVNGVWEFNSTYLSWGNEYLRTMVFYDTTYGITAGDSGTVHRTFDGGDNWDTVSTLTTEIIWDLYFMNDSTIFAVVDSSQNSLMISTDSGATWQPHMMSLTFYYPTLYTLTGSAGGLVVTAGRTSLTNEGMILWGKEDGRVWEYEPADYPLNDVTMANDSIAFSVGDSGLIITNSGVLNSVQSIEETIDVRIFPNPTHDYFSVSISHEQLTQVRVLDIQGRVVHNVNNGFDYIAVNMLSPGVYFVEVHSEKSKTVQSIVVK